MSGKRWIVCGLLLFGLGAGLSRGADPSEAYRADIERLMILTGSSELGKQMALAVTDQFVATITQTSPDFSPRAIEVTGEVMERHFDIAFRADGGLMHEIVNLYAKYFTHEEILGLISFYQTPLGRKASNVMPALTQDMFRLGQVWAAQQAPLVQAKLMERLKKEGFAE